MTLSSSIASIIAAFPFLHFGKELRWNGLCKDAEHVYTVTIPSKEGGKSLAAIAALRLKKQGGIAMHHSEKKKDKFKIRVKPNSIHPAQLDGAGEFIQQIKRAGLMAEVNAERGR